MHYLAKAWSGKLILERINVLFACLLFPSYCKYVSASGDYMCHFIHRRGPGIWELLPSMQNERCPQPRAGIILITNVTHSVMLIQLNSQKVHKTILL